MNNLIAAQQKYYDETLFKAIVDDGFYDDCVDFYTASNQYINSLNKTTTVPESLASFASATKATSPQYLYANGVYGSTITRSASGTGPSPLVGSGIGVGGGGGLGGFSGIQLGTTIQAGFKGTVVNNAMKALQSNVIIKTKYTYSAAISSHLDMYLLKHPAEEPNFGFIHMSTSFDNNFQTILCFNSQRSKSTFEQWLAVYKTLFQHSDDLQTQQYPTPPVGEISLVKAKSSTQVYSTLGYSYAGRKDEWEFISQRCYGKVGLMECSYGSYWAFSDPNDAVVFQLGMEK